MWRLIRYRFIPLKNQKFITLCQYPGNEYVRCHHPFCPGLSGTRHGWLCKNSFSINLSQHQIVDAQSEKKLNPDQWVIDIGGYKMDIKPHASLAMKNQAIERCNKKWGNF